MTPAERVELLLARAERDPDDGELRSVLADALVEAGDPRGELAAVQIKRVAVVELANALLQRHRRAVYGPELEHVQLGIDKGFIDTISITLHRDHYKRKVSAQTALDAIFQRRAASKVESIDLRLDGRRAGKDLERALVLIAAELPALRRLEIATAAEFSIASLHRLTCLEWLVLRAPPSVLKEVFAGVWPGIRRLEIMSYGGGRQPALAQMARVFAGTAFPDLEELVPELSSLGLAKLLASPLVANQLRVLDLSMCAVDAAMARQVAATRQKLGRLVVAGVPEDPDAFFDD